MEFDENKNQDNFSEQMESIDIAVTEDAEYQDEKGKVKTSTAVMAVAVSVLISIVITCFGTIFIMHSLGFNTLGLSRENWEKLKWGFSAVNDVYYEDINEDELVDGALMGLSVPLDEYSMYMPVDNADQFMESVNAEDYCGVGMQIYSDTIDDCVRVVMTMPGSPAEKAGLKENDIIKAVDGEEIGADVDKASSLLMGEKGTEVIATVIKADSGEAKDIKIIRDEIKQDVISAYMIKDDIGYIKLSRFGIDTYGSFVDKLNELTENGMEKLVLDLRDNPGGYFDSAATIAEIFLDKNDMIISTKDGTGHITEFRASTEGMDMEIVILCNGNTASAAEVLTAALCDNGKAKTVGTKTYGKGVTQAMVSYYDGSMFKITDTRYYTPNGECIDKKGIEPDIKVENIHGAEKDAQLEAAVKELL